MKNQYFGDKQDYRKYGLLRCVSEATGLPVGVLWLLTSDDGRSDGEFRKYLQDPKKWRRRDPELFDALTRLLEPGVERDVAHAREWGLLPGAHYFEEVFGDAGEERRAMFGRALEAMRDCPFVFLDPDNGIEAKSVGYGRKNSRKFVYRAEIQALYERGHSLVIYQHYPRETRVSFEARIAGDLRDRLRPAEVALFSTAHVGFFLAMQAEHAAALPEIAALVARRWAGEIGFRRFGAADAIEG